MFSGRTCGRASGPISDADERPIRARGGGRAQSCRELVRETKTGLGLAFLEAIDVVVAQIVDAPHSFPIVHYAPSARRVVAHRFPYLVVYVVREDTIHVVAFAHAKRVPGYWVDRLDETED